MTSQQREILTEATVIVAPNNAETTFAQNHVFKRQIMFTEGFKATTTYQDSLIFDARGFKAKSFHMVNPDPTNSLLYKILSTIDGVHWKELLAETTLTAGQDDMQDDAGAKAFYKFSVKTSAGTIAPIGVIGAWT